MRSKRSTAVAATLTVLMAPLCLLAQESETSRKLGDFDAYMAK